MIHDTLITKCKWPLPFCHQNRRVYIPEVSCDIRFTTVYVGERERETLWVWVKTERMTEMRSVPWVKCSSPRIPLSCWRHTTVAAPAMNPTIVACDRKSTINPNLHKPVTNLIFVSNFLKKMFTSAKLVWPIWTWEKSSSNHSGKGNE